MHGLTVRPGTVVRDYLAGRTVPYTNPITYLLICCTAFALSARTLGATVGDEFDRALIALVVPFIAAVSRLLFWRTRLDYAEHLVLGLYVVGHVALILAVLQAVLSPAIRGNPGTAASAIFALSSLGIAVAYYAWAFSRVFPTRPWLAAAGGLVALAGGIALWLAVVAALGRCPDSRRASSRRCESCVPPPPPRMGVRDPRDPSRSMRPGVKPGTGRLAVGLAVYLVLAVPLFAYLWSTLNELLAGDIRPVRLGIAVIVLPLFIGVLYLMVRSIHRWEARRQAAVSGGPGEGG